MQALVIFVEGLQTIPSTLEVTKHANLDLLVKDGCMGTLLPRPLVKEGPAADHSLLRQLLGIHEAALPPYDSHLAQKAIHTELSIPQRWFGTKAALLSDSPSLLEIANSLGFSSSTHLTSATEASLETNITNFLATPQAEGGLDVCVVHMHCATPALRESRISLLDQLAPFLLKQRWLTCIVGSYLGQQEPEPVSAVHPLRPPQSYEWKDGKKIANANLRTPLYALWYHSTSARRDNCKTFTEKEAATHGCYKEILLEHFFGEIAFKIGRAPKYGA